MHLTHITIISTNQKYFLFLSSYLGDVKFTVSRSKNTRKISKNYPKAIPKKISTKRYQSAIKRVHSHFYNGEYLSSPKLVKQTSLRGIRMTMA